MSHPDQSALVRISRQWLSALHTTLFQYTIINVAAVYAIRLSICPAGSASAGMLYSFSSVFYLQSLILLAIMRQFLFHFDKRKRRQYGAYSGADKSFIYNFPSPVQAYLDCCQRIAPLCGTWTNRNRCCQCFEEIADLPASRMEIGKRRRAGVDCKLYFFGSELHSGQLWRMAYFGSIVLVYSFLFTFLSNISQTERGSKAVSAGKKPLNIQVYGHFVYCCNARCFLWNCFKTRYFKVDDSHLYPYNAENTVVWMVYLSLAFAEKYICLAGRLPICLRCVLLFDLHPWTLTRGRFVV